MRYRLRATFAPLRPIDDTDLLAAVLGALPESVEPAAARVEPLPGTTLLQVVVTFHADPFTAARAQHALERAPGLPPVDAISVRTR